jgi:acetyltransferase-like isoleucine patch superfamily enzyme
MNQKNIKTILREVMRNPLRYLIGLCALLKGSLYIVSFLVFKPRVKIRFPFFAYHKVAIKGPGSVFIDRNCSVYKNVLQGLSIVTLSPTARVTIGQGCALGGVTVRCRTDIDIDDNTMAGYSVVQDCLITEKNTIRYRDTDREILEAGPIKIGKNVWLGGRSGIFGGTTIENDSVISAGSVCYKSRVPEYCLASGNPIMRPSPIPKILNFKKGT